MTTRPSIDLLASSVDTGILGGGVVGDDARQGKDSEDTVESLVARLNIEKRIQYGAEKFLEALDSEHCSIPPDNRPALRAKVGDEYEASNMKIKDLQARIDRKTGGTPLKPRRRAQPMLNGFASSLSLSTNSTSMGAPTTTSPGRSIDHAKSPRAPLSRLGSSSTTGSTASHRRARSRSAGEDVFYEQRSLGIGGMSWLPPRVGDMEEGESDEETDMNVGQAIEELEALLLKLEEANGSKEGFGLMDALIKVFKRSDRVRYELDLQRCLDRTLIYATDASVPQERAAAYRLFRYLLIDRAAWGVMVVAGIEWLLIRTFTRDAKHAEEKEQALKLLRTVMLLPPMPPITSQGPAQILLESPAVEGLPQVGQNGDLPISERAAGKQKENSALSEALIRSLVSIAENREDTFQAVCLETLAELALIDLPCLVDADAFRVILQALHDGPHEIGPSLMSVLLLILDCPSRRTSLPTGIGIDIVLTGFTDGYGYGSAHLDSLKGSFRKTAVLLRSWSGLMHCCMHDNRGIKSLVESLRVPVVEMREVLLDLFFQVFRLKVPSWYEPFLGDNQMSNQSRAHHSWSKSADGKAEESEEERLSVVDQYISLLLAIFIDCGIIESLIALVEENQPVLMRKATLLISEILQLSNRLLPAQYAARIQALPRLFELASAFATPAERTSALSALSVIDNLNRDRTRLQGQRANKGANSPQDSVQRGQRQVEQVRIRMGIQVDDRQFQSMLVDSQILYTKDHNKWNYDIIMEIVEGPLLNPRRLEEVFRVSKFGRRLLSFFHPLSRRFSDIRLTGPNRKWIRLGTALIATLLTTPDGIRYLTEDALLRQLLECFSELDQYAGQLSAVPYFSKSRIESTLSEGYFDMLGVMTKSTEGISVLESFKFFTCLYHVSEMRSRDDLVRAIIEHFDYTIDGHSRILLSKALTSSYMHTRILATKHLGKLLPELGAPSWALQLLITQLYDSSMEVCDVAVGALERACESLETLEEVVKLRPTLEHLGEVGAPLLLRFLSTSVGFSYLRQADYIDREMDEWFHERNLQYVVQIEIFLSRVFGSWQEADVGDFFFDGTAPPHFYGEIAKTEAGCQTLRDKGHFQEFALFLRQHAFESNDLDLLAKLKSVLWAVGNIGSTNGGLPFLEEENIVELIVDIAENSPLLTIRGTCFFVLGLISSTVQGAEILEDLEWVATTTPLGVMTGLCIPQDISKFTTIEPWEGRPLVEHPPLPSLSKLEDKILSDISDLGNYVLATQAMRSLARLRHRHRPLFSSVPLFLRAVEMISQGHFLQPVRCFIVNMFDVTFDLETLIALRSERERCDQYMAAEAQKALKEVKSAEYTISPMNKAAALEDTTSTVLKHRIVTPLSPARKDVTENSVPSVNDKWVEKEGREAKVPKTVVVGFEV